MTRNKYSISFLLLLFLSCAGTCFSQQKKIDSLQNLLKTSIADSTRFKLLIEITSFYTNSDPKKGIVYGKQALELAEKLGKKERLAEALTWLGDSYRETGNYEDALDHLGKALSIYLELGMKIGASSVYNNIGNVYVSQGNYDKAMENYLGSLKLNEDAGDKSRIASCCSNIGTMLYNKAAITHRMGDDEEALEYHKRALSLDKELNDKYGISVDLLNLGTVLSDEGKLKPVAEIFKKAISYYNESLILKKEVDDKDGTAIDLVNICDADIQLAKLNKSGSYLNEAVTFGKKALVLFHEVGDDYGEAFAYGKVGECFGNEKESGGVAALGDSSLLYYQKGLSIGERIQAKDLMKDSYNALSDVYAGMNNYKEALKYHHLFGDIKDSMLNEETSKHMNEMQAKYETVKKDKEIASQKADAEKQGLIRNGFIIGFVLMIALAFFIFNGYRQKQKANRELTEKNEVIEEQKKIVEEKQKEILDSIHYARRIQRSILPTEKYIDRVFKERNRK